MEFLEEKPSLCTVCGEAFTTLDALNLHKETEHQNNSIINMFPEEKPSLCTVCDEAFMNKDAFHVHKETEHSNYDLIVFPKFTTLKNKTSIATVKMDESSCQNTGGLFSVIENENSLKTQESSSFQTNEIDETQNMHREFETDRKPLLCDLCHEIFTDEEKLVSHKSNMDFSYLRTQSLKVLEPTSNLYCVICVMKHLVT